MLYTWLWAENRTALNCGLPPFKFLGAPLQWHWYLSFRHKKCVSFELLQITTFLLTKNYFSKFAKIFKTKLVRSKFFLQFVEEMEKLKLSLSKQHNKMLKIESQCWKSKKKSQNNQARKNFPRKFTGISRIPEIPKIFGIPEFSQISPKIFWKFFVSRVVKNSRKKKTLSLAVSRTSFGPLRVQFCCFFLA